MELNLQRLGVHSKKTKFLVMKQSKKHSALESATNVILGLVISFLIQLVLYPILGLKVSLNQNLIITFVFFVASFLRGYLIRRFFNKL